jgi:hypothetical protein
MEKKENKIKGRYELSEKQHSDLNQIKIWLSEKRDEAKYPRPLTLTDTLVEMINHFRNQMKEESN